MPSPGDTVAIGDPRLYKTEYANRLRGQEGVVSEVRPGGKVLVDWPARGREPAASLEMVAANLRVVSKKGNQP